MLHERWLAAVTNAAQTLRTLSDADAQRRPAPDKWSMKEIIGHLIDSAANNHRRFVIAQLRDGLTFDGYEQDGWVSAQRYQESAWPELVNLWEMYNRHLIHLTKAIPADVLDRREIRHNFYDIASRSVPAGEPTTLRFFIEDYVFHLEHHLTQIRGLLPTS